jgi:glycosyltransferase involved in cell wall biosynthesis
MARIAVVDLLFNWPPDGGARTDVREITARMARGNEAELFVPDFPFHFPRGRILREPGFPVTTIPFTPLTFNCVQAPRRFRHAVERFRPDRVFIADGWFLKPYLVNALKRYRPAVRMYAYEWLCFNLHGTFLREGAQCDVRWMGAGFAAQVRCARCGLAAMRRKGYRHFIHEFLASLAFLPGYARVVRRALANAGTVIVYNEFAREMIGDMASHIQVTPSGVDAALFSFTPPGPRCGPLRVLMSGRIADETKGFEILRRACAELWGERKDFRLVVTTEWERRYDDPFIETRVWMPQEKLPALYAESDLCVFPSIWQEPQGIAPLEAMSCGRPVVVTRVGGLQRLVEDGVQGYVVPPGDTGALKERIVRLLDDRALRERMGCAGRKRVEERYTWDIIYDRYYRHLFEQGI